MHAAFRSGAVMGFLLASLGLLVLFITIKIFALVRHTPRVDVISYGCAHA
jgi:Na+/H+-translocating membrane pyrophosphatase